MFVTVRLRKFLSSSNKYSSLISGQGFGCEHLKISSFLFFNCVQCQVICEGVKFKFGHCF